VQFVGVQVDVTSKTEGTAVGDKSGVPLLVKYDTRLRENGKNAVNEINSTVQVWSAFPAPRLLAAVQAAATGVDQQPDARRSCVATC